MARRRNRRRQPRHEWQLPRVRIDWRWPMWFAGTGVVAWLVFELAVLTLDQPIRAIEIEGGFQRVSALDIEAALRTDIGRGFFTADLGAMRARLESLPWVDRATIRRAWPDTLRVEVREHVAAARWGDAGLLNTRGELFMEDARHVPAELPRLAGPEGSEYEVAEIYLELHRDLAALGLTLASVELDARGAWRIALSDGLEVRFGRREVDARMVRFLNAAEGALAGRLSDIDYVDMRYSNGFSVGWTERALARSEAGEGPSG